MTDYGLDISGYNAITNWAAVRAVPNWWVWSKATQGSGYTNPRFAGQFTGAAAAGLAAGAYHFPDPNVSVAANVSHFAAIAGPVGAFAKGAFVPMLDVEDDTADGIRWTAPSANAFIPAFRDQLRAATGQRKLCVYAPQSWWANGFLRPDDWADQDVFLCVARYGFGAGNTGWSHPRLAVHQYTDGTAQFGSTLYRTDRSVTVGGYTAIDLTIGSTGARNGGNMAVFLKNMDTNEYATQDGPLVTGVREAVGAATLKAWPGASCEIGLNNQEFADRVNKSKALEGLAAAIAQLPAQLAKVMPATAGSLTADQLTAAVVAGVQAGLDGITETSVLHKPGN